jgi:signal transduction histidine kinase/ligand-binding sensor domain-containing protein
MRINPLFVFLTCLVFSGCWFSNRNIPLPDNASEFSKPVQKPFQLSEPRKIKWNPVHHDSSIHGQISPFDMNKLPVHSFNPEGFNALLNPMKSIPFHYNNLPDSSFDLDKIPSEPLILKVMVLGTIKKTTLGLPRLRAESFFTSFQYGEEQGLPGGNAKSILRSKDGFLWIATNEGLCILKGESMETIPFHYGDIYALAEDKQGLIWVRTSDQGVFIIDRKAGIQKQIVLPRGFNLRIDKQGYIWICTFLEGIYLVNPDLKTYKNLKIKNGLSGNGFIRTFEDSSGRVWLSSSNGVDILDFKEKKIKRLGTSQGLSSPFIISLAENRSGDIFAGTLKKGIDIINFQKETIQHLDSVQGLEKCLIFNMLNDDEDRMWIATDSLGIFILNRTKDSITHVGSREGLGDDATWFLYKDDQHQIYVGTTTAGFNIFPSSNHVAHLFKVKNGLLDDQVWGLLEDDKKRLWVGTYSGINIITPDQKIYSLIPNPKDKNDKNRIDPIIQTGPDQFKMAGDLTGLIMIDESKHTIEKIGLKEGLPETDLFNLYKDSHGMIWIGTIKSGLILFDPHTRIMRYLNKTSGLSSNRVTQVIEDPSGKFWISTFGGVDQLDLKENSIRSYTTAEGLSDDRPSSILLDKKNRLWVTSEKGLNLLDPVQKTNTIFSIASGMPGNGVYSLLENKGRIYAGTEKGLTALDENEKTTKTGSETTWNLRTYGRAQGFYFLNFNGNTAAITHTSAFWWGIIEGITMADSTVISRDSNIAPVQVTGLELMGKQQFFIDPVLIKDADTLWGENKDTFYLKGNFKAINTERLRGIEWDSLSSNFIPVNLSLPPDRNYIRFHFSDKLTQSNGEYKYIYILDGVDDKWSPVTTEPISENYNNISPGYYTFRISSKKGGGPWSELSVYHFRIRPPWWQSWWAELSYLLIFIGVLRLWVRYRSRRLLKENALLEQKVTDRTTALSTSLENLRQTQSQLIQAEKMASLGELTAGIAHEIQNPLNFVNNFSEVNTELIEEANKALDQGDISEVKEIMKDVEMNMSKITFHGKRADAIVKGMLLHSRASSGIKIPTDVNALADEYLRLSYHGLRARDKSFNAQFSMDFDESLKPVLLLQQDIGRVLLNIFNNAFYSASEKKKTAAESYQPTVSVSTKKKNGMVEIRIHDNGQGIPRKVIDKIFQPFFTTKPAGQGTGLGLSLSYDIITKEHGGKINVITKENEFTEFFIELPAQTAV